jgi:hypothetical protein
MNDNEMKVYLLLCTLTNTECFLPQFLSESTLMRSSVFDRRGLLFLPMPGAEPGSLKIEL